MSKSGSGVARSMIAKDYRKGYTMEALPYQEYGILAKTLWPSKSSVIRIVPGYDPETGEVFRQNINVNEFSSDAQYTDYLSDTFYQARIVEGLGGGYGAIITDYEPGSPEEQKWGGDTLMSVFIRKVMYAVSDKGKQGRDKLHPLPEWSQWCGLQGGTIRFNKSALLMQALVFTVNGRDNVNADGEPLVDDEGDILPLYAVVAIDNKKSVEALCQALVEPSNPGLPLDPKTNNKYGPMAELDGNKLFLNSVTDPEKGHSMLRPSVQAGSKGWTPTPFPISEDIAKSLWVPWDRLLQYMTMEEQAKYLATCFGADTVNYVIKSEPRFANLELPAEVAAAGYGRYSQFTDGVKEVRTSTTLSSAPAFGKPAGMGAPKPAPAAKPLSNAFAPKKDPLSSVPANSGVDREALRKEMERMRAGSKGLTAKTKPVEDEDEQDMASELLDDMPFGTPNAGGN